MLENKLILDAGCGTGWFTKAIIDRSGKVIAIDIGERLVKITKEKNSMAHGVVGSILAMPFKENAFGYVISSDVIEHTSNPLQATRELVRVLKKWDYLYHCSQ
ncbi:MAG: class I SAM-dependent methyltransferase [bacterium]|nr:class I SAM-dependent methyltransferase [bacterium]